MASAQAAPSGRYGPAEILLLAVLSAVWGAAYVLIRQGLLLGATPLAFASARYALSALVFFAIAAANREAFPTRRALATTAGFSGLLMIGLYGGFLYWGEQYTTGGYAAVLASTAPILTVALSFVVLRAERLGPWGMLGIAIGFGGTAVLVLPELTGSSLGTWEGPVFILGAMTCAAVGSVYLRRYGGGRQGLWQIGCAFAVASLLLGTGAVVLPLPEALPLTLGVIGSLVLLVAFSSVVGYFAYFALHHRVGPVRANLVAYLVPLVGVAIGTGLYGEPVTAWELGGVAIVLAGVSLVLWESSRRQASPTGAPGPGTHLPAAPAGTTATERRQR